MSFSFGFYNSVNHDRKYDSKQISSMFEGLITDGVYRNVGDCFALSVNDGLKLNVGAGRAWFDLTWSYNDTPYILTLQESHAVFDRIDAIVIRVNKSARTNEFAVVTGTPASDPVKPTLQNADGVFEHPLGYVTVGKGKTALSATDINQVIGTTECPFVTSLMESVSIDKLMKNWVNEFDILFAELKKQTSQAAAGTLIDGSVTNIKLANDAVRLRFRDVLVEPKQFETDATYSEYGYECRGIIPLHDVTENMKPDVTFSPESMANIDLNGPVFSYDGGIYLYLACVPESDFTIPVIDLWR